jgi:hypothetical protein
VSGCTARVLRSLYALDFVDDRRRRLSRFNRYVCIKVSWLSFVIVIDCSYRTLLYLAHPHSPSLTLTHPHSPSLTLTHPHSPSAHPRLTHAHPRLTHAHPRLTHAHSHSPSLTHRSPTAHPRRMIMKAHPTPLLRNIAGHHG